MLEAFTVEELRQASVDIQYCRISYITAAVILAGPAALVVNDDDQS